MQSVSLFEQLTRNVPLSIVSGVVLALTLISTIVCRVFFFSTKSKQHSKTNEKKQSTKKQPNETTSGNKKKTVKAKKNVVPVSSSTPSEESEDEKTTLVPQTKKVTPSNQVAKDKKTVAVTKQTPTNNTDVQEKNGDNKKKQSKTGGTSTTANEKVTNNKQATSGKGDTTNKLNGTVSNKKQPVVTNSETKRTPTVNAENGSDQEDDGQWVTQSNKQVNNRSRNKGKTESSPPALTNNRTTLSEKHSVPTTNKVESDVEPSTQPKPAPEPIEVCQLIPKTADRYTVNNSWWKQPLNQNQTFSINDIEEWPENELDEQYIVQVKRIVPVQNRNDA